MVRLGDNGFNDDSVMIQYKRGPQLDATTATLMVEASSDRVARMFIIIMVAGDGTEAMLLMTMLVLITRLSVTR